MTVAGIDTWTDDQILQSNETNWKITDLKANLLNLLVNKYVITILAVTISSLFLGIIAVIQTQSQLVQTPTHLNQVDARNCDATQIACLEAIRSNAQNQLRNTQVGEIAKITQFDLNPENPTERGYLQMILGNETIDFNHRVQSVRGDKNDPNFGRHPDAIKHDSMVTALKKVNLGAGGEGSTLVWNDPANVKTDETGKPVLDVQGKPINKVVHEKLSPHLTQALGILQILVINSSRNPNLSQSDSIAIALDLINGQEEVKTAVISLLRLQGLDPVANEIERRDMYGRSVVPNIPDNSAPGDINPLDNYNPFPGGF